MSQTLPKAYIISLPDCVDRREKMSKQMEKFGLEYEFIDAVDCRGKDIYSIPEYDYHKRLKYFGRNMSGGEIGCFLSHKKFIEMMIDQDIEEALFLEDDAILFDDFAMVLKSLVQTRNEYELVRFLGQPKIATLKQKYVCDLGDGYHLSKLSTTPGGAFAVLFKKSAALKLKPFLEHFYLPIDTIYGQSWKTKVKWRVTQPGLAVGDDTIPSTIGDKRFDKRLQISGVARLLFPFNRFILKIREAIGKKYYYYFGD